MVQKAIVIGAFSFVGYSLVEKLLAEEAEVLGIDTADAQHKELAEEKLFGIGRHAGFTYVAAGDFSIERLKQHGSATVYVCAAEPNGRAFTPIDQLAELLSFCRVYKRKLVLLSSVEAAAVRLARLRGEADPPGGNGRFFYELETAVERELTHYSVLQVPIVYGPWQPTCMLYQQLLLQELTGRAAAVAEQGYDAVYVADAAACLYELAGKEGLYYMESGQTGQWQRGIELLGSTAAGVPAPEHAARRIVYEPVMTLEEGLAEQRRHVQLYQHIYDRMS